jgi:hypothetical protein
MDITLREKDHLYLQNLYSHDLKTAPNKFPKGCYVVYFDGKLQEICSDIYTAGNLLESLCE